MVVLPHAIMVPLTLLWRPWLTASSSSHSEACTRLHYSSYLVILLILSSILSGPTFPIVIFSRNLSKHFSHGGFSTRVPIDPGWVKVPVVGSFYTSRHMASKVGLQSRTCVHVIVGGCMLSYLSSQNQHPAWARCQFTLNILQRANDWYEAGKISWPLYCVPYPTHSFWVVAV
jgi:hypothetical protein